jgi:hypothetical protein
MSYRGALSINLHVRELERGSRLVGLYQSASPAQQASSIAPAARRWVAAALRGLAVWVMAGESREPATAR